MSPRPNALDQAVNALSDATLLSHPASALVDSARAEAADRLMHLMLAGWFVTFALQIVVLAYFWQSGLAARVRDRLRRRFRNEFVVRFLFGAVLALVGRAAGLLPELYIYRVQRAMSLSDQLLRAWAADWIANTIVTMIVVGIAVAIVLWIVDRTHQWYIYLLVAIVLASAGLSFIEPYVVLPRFGHYAEIPPEYRADAASLEARAHVKVPLLEHVDDRTHLGDAYVNGLGPSQRIVISDSIFQASSRREIRYVLARELGFIAIGGPLRIAVADAVFVIVGVALAVAIADRIGFRRDDDPMVRLALLGALLGLMYLAIVPFNNTMLRSLSWASEEYALTLTHDPAAAVRSIVRNADERLDAACVTGAANIFRQEILDPAHAVETANHVPSGCR
ncbi:MAG: M48 family metalloprotease [Candidatus Eremiobacteraeota bacterium]|nr:M48 family metalloprotease [Candidatus Eremiobacteraeota bacterium]